MDRTLLLLWLAVALFSLGLLGVIVAMLVFSRRNRISPFLLSDLVSIVAPIGLFFGRLANFINGELWGRPTDVPWAMVFPSVDRVPRHPSQLYEFALEGVALFLILWWFSARPRPRGAVSALFLIGYGVFRFLAEFTREPDSFLGVLALGLTMGQWLSAPMVIAGVAMLLWVQRTPTH